MPWNSFKLHKLLWISIPWSCQSCRMPTHLLSMSGLCHLHLVLEKYISNLRGANQTKIECPRHSKTLWRPEANENLSVLARWPTSTWDRSKWSKLSTAMYRHKSWVANTTGYYRDKNCAPLGRRIRPIDTYVQSIPLHQTQQYQQWHTKTYVYVNMYI